MNINELKPNDVFRFFGEICAIPHGSGNTSALSDYCVRFAEERGLKSIRDELGNVIIFKEASEGKENSAPVILQGHLDMVCDKFPDCTKDMQTEGVQPLTDGEYVWADRTTLGADDGIALAYILAILDDDSIARPPIEALFTVDEEVGLIGAEKLDCSPLRGRRLINIDSEEEGILTVGCAGGVRVICELPVKLESCGEGSAFAELSIGGLLGGHSGIDIDKHRKNASVLLGRLLYRLRKRFDIGICSLNGGAKMNTIPNAAKAVVRCGADDIDSLLGEAAAFADALSAECRVTEPNVKVSAEVCGGTDVCTDIPSTDTIVFALMQSPDGVISTDPEIEGMVQTSVNMGVAELCGEKLEVCCFIRSNDKCGKQPVIDKLAQLYEHLGGKITLSSDYPPWEYRADSPLRETMVRTYRELYGKDVRVMSIHAGLECGTLSAKLGDADMISIGPDMENVHTPNERLSVDSAARCYEYLLAVLEKL